MQSLPSNAKIRQFLTETFSDAELVTLCFEDFRDVYDDFAPAMSKGDKIQRLIEHCDRHGTLPNLLAAIQRARPEQYEQWFPQAAKPEVPLETTKLVYNPDLQAIPSQPEPVAEPQTAHMLQPMPRTRPHLPGAALLVAGGVLVVLILTVIACLAGSTICDIVKSIATQTAVAAVRSTEMAAPTHAPAPALVPAETRPPTSTPTPMPTATQTPTMTPTPGICPTRVAEKDGMVMVCVPAGGFLMGSTGSDLQAKDDEKPQHKVYLDAYWIDQTEVTNAQYKKCVQETQCTVSGYANDSRYNGDNQPVVGVNWYGAKAYCEWAGRHLPTEAQWEKAARGTDGRIYPWGNTPPDSSRLNFLGQVGKTTEVGKYPNGASPYGALDMAGNVWEWTSSLDKPYPYKADDGREDMSSSGDRVRRGGAFRGIETDVRAAFRHPGNPDWVWDTDGFRCAVGIVFPISLK